MDIETSRRRFLTVAGTGAATSFAGCNALSGDSTTGEATTTGSGGTATVTVLVQLNQQKLRQRQADVRAELRAGNISRQEARRQVQRIQSELRSAAMTTFEERAASTALSIEDSLPEFGVFLVSAPPATLVDALSFESVRALYPESDFRKAKRSGKTATPSG